MTRSSAGRPRTCTRMPTPRQAAAKEAARPSQWPQALDRRPASSRNAAEAAGTAMSSQAQEASPVASVRGVTTAVTGAGSMSVVSPLSS